MIRRVRKEVREAVSAPVQPVVSMATYRDGKAVNPLANTAGKDATLVQYEMYQQRLQALALTAASPPCVSCGTKTLPSPGGGRGFECPKCGRKQT